MVALPVANAAIAIVVKAGRSGAMIFAISRVAFRSTVA